VLFMAARMMDIRQWALLRLLCMLLVHAYLSVAAAPVGWAISMLHGGSVQNSLHRSTPDSMRVWIKTQLNLTLMLCPSRA